MWRFMKQTHWHDKGFTLTWDFPDTKWVLLRFINGQKKPWYKFTERKYRFKRWFFLNNPGKFSNIANIESPRVVLYAFPWYISIPKKVVIPMNVQHLVLETMPLQMQDIPLHVNNALPPETHSQIRTRVPQLTVSIPTSISPPQIKMALPEIQMTEQFSFHCSDWLETGAINSQNINVLTLKTLIQNSHNE
jgi:hypothetical protein